MYDCRPVPPVKAKNVERLFFVEGKYVRSTRASPVGPSFWALLAWALAMQARGAVYEVTAQTEAQAYDMRSYGCPPGQTTACGDPSNPTLLPRRFISESIGIAGIELIKDQDLSFDSSLRLWSDFGITQNEAKYLDSNPSSSAQLLFAYVTWRDLFGILDVRLGRQFFADELDFIDFDGAHLKFKVGRWGSVEAFGGVEVQGSWYLGSSNFQPDGTRETDARRLLEQSSSGVNVGASYYLGEPAYVIGARATVNLLQYGDLRVGYQRSMSAGTDYNGANAIVVETEHAGASLRLHPFRGVNAYASADYNLALAQLARGRAGITYTTPIFGITLEAQRITPSFSTDSIWAYFAFAPRDEFRLRADITPRVGPFRYYLEAINQRYRENLQQQVFGAVVISPYPCTTASPSSCEATIPSGVTLGGRGGAALVIPDPWRADVDVSYVGGWGGRQLWANAHVGLDLDHGRYSIDVRGSLANVQDGLNPYLQGTFVGGNLSAGIRLIRGVKLTAVAEENTNPYTMQDFRLYGLLDVGIAL